MINSNISLNKRKAALEEFERIKQNINNLLAEMRVEDFIERVTIPFSGKYIDEMIRAFLYGYSSDKIDNVTLKRIAIYFIPQRTIESIVLDGNKIRKCFTFFSHLQIY